MSVIVKGMEMPNNCYDCPFIRASYAGDYYCAKGNGTEDDLKKVYGQRMADCPLVELPPHGRLIDADELNIHDVSPAYGFCVMGVTEEDIELAETVIEAEGSEE